MIKRITQLLTFTGYLLLSGCATVTQIADAMSQSLLTPTNTEINSALKEALEQATGISSERLNLKDGYLTNLDIKILFPPEAKQIENTLRSIGLGSMVDKVVVSVNRAAEDAAIKAKPIFQSAVKQMTIVDVKNILLGENNAATQYFSKTTSDSLNAVFSPVIDQSLKKVDATKYWEDATTRYNKIPFVKKVDTDLTAYVTQKAIDGLFIEIAKEELKIREQVSARKSALLQKVFGYAEKEKK
jgi:hypothetical protein